MAFTDPEKRRAYARAHYERHRQKYIDAAKRRQDVQRWRAKRKAAGLRASGDYHMRLRERVNRAAKQGREYWPVGCRVKVEQPRGEKAARPSKPWHGLKGAEKHRVRWKHDPQYRIYHRMKRWMQKHLRNGRPSERWSRALGYQPSELAQHIERQFVRGMSWHNMGKWHIDHIVPVREFRFTSPSDEDFRACYALSNLRPVWAHDNLVKGGARTHLI